MKTALSTLSLLTLSTLLLTAEPAVAARTPCPHARYRLTGAPLAAAEVLEVGGIVALDGACDEVAPKR